MTQLIYSKMPKTPTAGMTWTVSRDKHPALRRNKQSGYYSSAPVTDMNSTRTSEQFQQITISTVPQKSKGTSYCSSNSNINHDKLL